MDKKKRKRIITTVVTFLLILYFITWAFGVPAIHNRAASDVIFAWEQKLEFGNVDARPVKPSCRFGVAFAIFPGLIVSRYDSQTSSTGAESGWSIYLWYGLGIKRIFFYGDMA